MFSWLTSLMASKATSNQKDSRASSDVEDSSANKRSRRSDCASALEAPPIDLMNFVEVTPLDPTDEPHARSGHRAIATDSDLWIWGGYYPFDPTDEDDEDDAGPMFAELWRFNFALRQWTLEDITGEGPTATLASHSMCRHRNLVFVFGGTGFPFGRTVSNQLFILDLKRRRWKRCELQDQQPEQVYGASLVANGDYLYILCGTNIMHYHSDVYEVHIPTLKCTQIGHTFDELEDFSGGGRYRQEAHICNDKIYLFGGGSNSGLSFSLENLPVFDLATRRWSFVHTNPDPSHQYPTPRKFHSVLPFGENRAVIFGGASYQHTTGTHIVASPHVWLFDFERLDWTRMASVSMVRPTYFHAAAMNDRGEIWTHGGVVRDSSRRAVEERITTVYKMHTQVLRLSEMCWNLFLNRLPDRTCLVKQPHLLAQLGIPASFRERLH